MSFRSRENSTGEDALDGLPPENTTPISERIKMLQNQGSDIKAKPPLLKKLSDPNKPPIATKPDVKKVVNRPSGAPPAVPQIKSLQQAAGNRVVSHHQYELAKTSIPGDPRGNYTQYQETDVVKVPDTSYIRARTPAGGGFKDAYTGGHSYGATKGGMEADGEEPEYAIYDVTRSSRFQPTNRATPYEETALYEDPAEPYYDAAASVKSFATSASTDYAEPYAQPCIPTNAWMTRGLKENNVHVEHYEATRGNGFHVYDEPDIPQTTKMSEISSKLKNQSLSSSTGAKACNSNKTVDDQYDHIHPNKGLRQNPRPQMPWQQEYGQLSHSHNKQRPVIDTETYDEIQPRK